MRARRIAIALLVLCALTAQAAATAGASQTPEAAWKITSTSLPTNFDPGSEGSIFLVAENLGAKATEGTITLTDQVPGELEIIETEDDKGKLVANISIGSDDFGVTKTSCEKASGQKAICTTADPLRPGYHLEVRIKVKVPLGAEDATNEATIKGGGAEDATTTSPVVVSPDAASFGFLPDTVGLDGPFTDPDGAATTQAGSHPYQLTVDLGFPTKLSGDDLVSAGHLHDAAVDFPRGVIINPAATSELCTEAELVSPAGCPPASQVGIATVLTFPAGSLLAGASALYNMVPPPGEAAVLGTEVLGVGVFAHLLGEVRSDGDYGLSGYATEIPALPAHPVFGSRVDLWGDPTAALHDGIRGTCAPPSHAVGTCQLEADQRTGRALLTLPGQCPADPLRFGARAHSWEELNAPAATTTYDGADLAGAPSHIQGCDQLKFEPALKLRPTTSLADSPAGLDAELTQTTDLSAAGESPSPLRDATVTLPQGLVANASQADGLEACSSAQIGMLSGAGQSPVRLSKQPNSCPDASKLGTIEVESPLLAQIDEEEGKIVEDAEGNPVPRLVHGNLFLAKPFDNPFGSLIAIYIVIEDPRSGVVAKLAGKVEPDPLTGQLRTRFTENPQLPFSAVRLHLFAGSRAPLQTPPACGSYTTTSALTPWAAPDLPDANPADSFEVSATPSGDACPASEAEAPNAPAFSAGTLSPQAKAFAPMVLKLSREDGSQRISKLEATLPGGLLARLAGVAQCSEAQIAAAMARSKPEEGKLEQASPSCPAASQIGTVDVGAGAGPSPLHIGGRAYLAGPYKGAPLSVVVITPAIAGPFDLGAVVVRSALYIDPTTAQGRAVSDPFPAILQGIPTDVRSVAVRVDRPNFTINPTSCDPKGFLALTTSTLGQSASLSSPFQVGGCEALGFKPKLTLRLSGGTRRGAHPAFKAVLTARGGDANIARSSVALPHSEFIDQAHFRTICTRVQFAANQCPAGAIYGHATAWSPLLDYALEGPVYLRSSSHKLPDLILALRGPPSQPVEVDLLGRVDSINGGIRTTFETVPDAPVTKAIVSMQGGKKGLFQNSTNICQGTHRATVKMDGQNGKFHDTRPQLQVHCGKGGGKGGKGKGGGGGKRR